ncbi:cytidine deaminase-like protein [Hyaloraphidium curvatum]|nr:cytidine deaminase-like protein [Hyaloraphidium curvatum]
MLVGLAGPAAAGKTTVAEHLSQRHGYQILRIVDAGEPSADSSTFPDADALLDFVMSDNNWRRDFVVDELRTLAALDVLRRRPFFVLVYVDAPAGHRVRRAADASNSGRVELFDLIAADDARFHDLAVLNALSDLRVVNAAPSPAAFAADLAGYVDRAALAERCRPSWDTYFMHLAALAARRSNCMKRRVGCILVRDKRVIATGYNGTPRGVRNCNEGGCARCNVGTKCGVNLDTCLCLHAEENALLEAGRERVEGRYALDPSSQSSATLYCNTCPCLQCAKRLVQVGVREVVYSQAYGMDEATKMLLDEAGVKLRQYRAPETSDILLCEDSVTTPPPGLLSADSAFMDSLETLALN